MTWDNHTCDDCGRQTWGGPCIHNELWATIVRPRAVSIACPPRGALSVSTLSVRLRPVLVHALHRAPAWPATEAGRPAHMCVECALDRERSSPPSWRRQPWRTEKMTENFDTALAAFLQGVERIGQKWGRPVTFETDVGPRYIRVVCVENEPDWRNERRRAVYCFVDRTNGEVLKGGWKGALQDQAITRQHLRRRQRPWLKGCALSWSFLGKLSPPSATHQQRRTRACTHKSGMVTAIIKCPHFSDLARCPT